jgi:uncharacterized membrane protein YdbT with pleckstrin-like domain
MHQLVLGFLLVTCATQQTRRTYIIKLGRYLEEMVILLVVMGLYIYMRRQYTSEFVQWREMHDESKSLLLGLLERRIAAAPQRKMQLVTIMERFLLPL